MDHITARCTRYDFVAFELQSGRDLKSIVDSDGWLGRPTVCILHKGPASEKNRDKFRIKFLGL